MTLDDAIRRLAVRLRLAGLAEDLIGGWPTFGETRVGPTEHSDVFLRAAMRAGDYVALAVGLCCELGHLRMADLFLSVPGPDERAEDRFNVFGKGIYARDISGYAVYLRALEDVLSRPERDHAIRSMGSSAEIVGKSRGGVLIDMIRRRRFAEAAFIQQFALTGFTSVGMAMIYAAAQYGDDSGLFCRREDVDVIVEYAKWLSPWTGVSVSADESFPAPKETDSWPMVPNPCLYFRIASWAEVNSPVEFPNRMAWWLTEIAPGRPRSRAWSEDTTNVSVGLAACFEPGRARSIRFPSPRLVGFELEVPAASSSSYSLAHTVDEAPGERICGALTFGLRF